MTVVVYTGGASVTVTDTAPPANHPTFGDWASRSKATGVVRAFKFDNAASLGAGYGKDFGTSAGTSTRPVLDSMGLRFDIPSLSGPNAAGTWWTNFQQFGENSEFFVQWRQRFNQAFIDTQFRMDAVHGGAPQNGIKLVDIVTGDQPNRIYNTCEALEIVVQTYQQHRFPYVYNSCTGSGTHPPYSPMFEGFPPYDFALQNAAPSCLYSQIQKQNAAGQITAVPPGCFGLVANEWLTFQVGVTVGPRNNVTNDFDNSRVRLWGQREGKPSQLLTDWKPGVKGYFPLAAGSLAENQKYGKLWFLPYMTNKDPLQVHDLCQTWYDEPIISTNRIADAQ